LNSTVVLSLLVVFIGSFTQSLSGFGAALVTMAVLPSLLGLQVATPLVALVSLGLETLMLIRYHASIQLKSIGRLLVASMIAIPFGVNYLRRVDEDVALFVLGIILAAYALYALIGFRLPRLENPLWAWIFGLASGLLGGAYNTSGPPVVVYGNCRGWLPQEFKSNLSGFFIVNSLMVVSTHWVSGNYTGEVTNVFRFALPALLLGFLLGQGLDRWLNPELFRRTVLVLLILLGIRLMV